MKIYLAGPMRGIELYNFPAFFKTAMMLREQGHIVFNPAERDMAEGFNPGLPLDRQVNGFKLEDVFRWDFEKVVDVDAVVILPGYKDSRGTQIELAIATTMGIKTYELRKEGLKEVKVTVTKVELEVADA